ncbi:MAG: SGNH/GDSL hydrolase family protein [Planctomycetota bacterium]|jgi:lysophospholipase L1-like esterase
MSESRRPFFRRKLWKRLALVCASLVVAGLLAEGLTRLLFPAWAPRTGRITKFWRYHSRYGWAHIPGVSGRFESYGIDAWVTINEKGFRGPTVAYARPPGRKRVVVLGDSYVWGFGVGDDEVFTALLDERMPDVEFVNLAVSGYGTDQELLLFRDEGREYETDLVLLVVAGNDFSGNLLRTQYVIYHKPVFLEREGKLELANVPVPRTAWPKRLMADLAMRSYALNALNRYLYRRAHEQTRADAGPPEEEPRPFPRTPAQKITVRLLRQLEREVTAGQAGRRFLVVLVDGLGPLAEDLVGYLDAHGIASVDLGAYLDGADPMVHLPDGFHWNVQGHKVVADVLAPCLRPYLD